MFIGEYVGIWYNVCGGKQAIEALSKRAQQDNERKEREELARLLAKYGQPEPLAASATLEGYVPASAASVEEYFQKLGERRSALRRTP